MAFLASSAKFYAGWHDFDRSSAQVGATALVCPPGSTSSANACPSPLISSPSQAFSSAPASSVDLPSGMFRSVSALASSVAPSMNGKPFDSLTLSELIPSDAEWQKVTCQYTKTSLPREMQMEVNWLAAPSRSSSAERVASPRCQFFQVEQQTLAWQAPAEDAAHQRFTSGYTNNLVGRLASSAAKHDSPHSPSMTRTESRGNSGMTLGNIAAPPRRSCNETKWVGKLSSSSNTPLLNAWGRDLTQIAANGELDPLIGREKEVEELIQALARRRKNNPLLIGDPGVGKTAVVEGVAQKIVNGDVPDMVKAKRIVQIDVATVLAGTQNRGDFEARMKNVVDELVASSSHVILFIDEIHTIIGAGRSGSCSSAVDAAVILKPALGRGDFQCIGATTLEEYRVHFENDASLERRFQPITVRPTGIKDTFSILKGIAPRYEAHHNVQYSEKAIEACVKLAAEYMPDRSLPDKAIDVFDEVGAFVHLRYHERTKTARQQCEEAHNTVKLNGSALQRLGLEVMQMKDGNLRRAAGLDIDCQQIKSRAISSLAKLQECETIVRELQSVVVTEEDVAHVISRSTGIPLGRLSEDESMRMLNLEAELNQRIVGQGPAIAAVSNVLRRARVGLKSPNRPIASFLFCGPTGVGKTELCKALSDVYFGPKNAMIRLDMSEFMEMHSVSRLIGSPAGYIGYGDENQLTDRIRRKPHVLILFDGLEKAHPAVLNVMLQIMDDGCLTDAVGRSVSFRNALVIMTFNTDAKCTREEAGGVQACFMVARCKSADHISSELREVFSSEFLNRLDGIIPFGPLGKNEVEDIAQLEFAKTIERVKQKGVSLTLSKAFKDQVIDHGFDAAYGARPLRRCIAAMLEDELANNLLARPLAEGEYIHVDVGCDQEVVVSRRLTRRDIVREKMSLYDISGTPTRKGTLGRSMHSSLSLDTTADTDSTRDSEPSEQMSSRDSQSPVSCDTSPLGSLSLFSYPSTCLRDM